jgi:multidrug efflux pump subunit AcrA (membrane-fusion protein)
MTANVNLFTGTLKNVIVLPVDTVIEQDGQHIVFIIENNKAQEVSVEVGESNDTQVEITKGLERWANCRHRWQ